MCVKSKGSVSIYCVSYSLKFSQTSFLERKTANRILNIYWMFLSNCFLTMFQLLSNKISKINFEIYLI